MISATTTVSTRNPFDLPELRHRLSRFVTLKDAISCALVAKAWTDEFDSAIWFQVDFKVHPRFANLPLDIVDKHGHRIRIVKNAKTFSQVALLAYASSIDQLRNLSIEIAASALQHARANKAISRNNMTLQDLHLFADSAFEGKKDTSTYYVSAPTLTPSSSVSLPSLSKLKIEDLCLTLETLVKILQSSPLLSELRLYSTDVVGTSKSSFQHTGVNTFASTVESIFKVAPTSHSPSLLSYFPNLQVLRTWTWAPSFNIPTNKMEKELAHYTPHVAGYQLLDKTGSIVSKFLNNIGKNLTHITFQYHKMTPETIKAILVHQKTLKSIKHFFLPLNLDYEDEMVAHVSHHCHEESGRFIQLIPRGCQHLEILDLHAHEMDMDEIEMGDWVCKDLRELRFRVKGLDTKDNILKAIALWRNGCWGRWREQAGTPVIEERNLSEADMSIEARVARHLLKFDKLWTVWLGYQTWIPI